jgi:protein-S-isoprenylcysteine O-methyltransferase Ste14
MADPARSQGPHGDNSRGLADADKRHITMRAARSSLPGILVLAALLFVPAGTLAYWQAWVFILVFVVASSAIGIHLAIKDPKLLERRMKFGPAAESEKSQKIIMTLSLSGIVALFVFVALDHRFGWSPVPPYVSLAGDALVALGFLINFLVFKKNTYGASTIQIAEGQKVISTGPYARVRHPMYAGVLVMVTGVPLALGSWWGLLVLAPMVPLLIWRLLDEEKFLKSNLPGYTEYAQKVHYRLVPFVW